MSGPMAREFFRSAPHATERTVCHRGAEFSVGGESPEARWVSDRSALFVAEVEALICNHSWMNWND